MSDKILIKKQILAPQESKKQTPPSLCDKPQILTDKSEIY
jgi:hypothetical protein